MELRKCEILRLRYFAGGQLSRPQTVLRWKFVQLKVIFVSSTIQFSVCFSSGFVQARNRKNKGEAKEKIFFFNIPKVLR